MLWKEDKREDRKTVLLCGQREFVVVINYERQYIQKIQFFLFIFRVNFLIFCCDIFL